MAPQFRPHVGLVDLNKPVMDGDELASRLRTLFVGGGVLLVTVTARGDEESRRRTATAGFVYPLVKPVDPHVLLGVMSELTRKTDDERPEGDTPGEKSA